MQEVCLAAFGCFCGGDLVAFTVVIMVAVAVAVWWRSRLRITAFGGCAVIVVVCGCGLVVFSGGSQVFGGSSVYSGDRGGGWLQKATIGDLEFGTKMIWAGVRAENWVRVYSGVSISSFVSLR
ncbi:Hypothetical predicted protein [Olea europaea subsp. europaea]|uniref:Uncharacterized protein n=1 Tax=Olea europaea subsp. europaea TaxID=158383 RepID=A0A8S0V5I8_OLEEU|nr:Hypothetical predicted protein [Olea europaea subsp. europaea]